MDHEAAYLIALKFNTRKSKTLYMQTRNTTKGGYVSLNQITSLWLQQDAKLLGFSFKNPQLQANREWQVYVSSVEQKSNKIFLMVNCEYSRDDDMKWYSCQIEFVDKRCWCDNLKIFLGIFSIILSYVNFAAVANCVHIFADHSSPLFCFTFLKITLFSYQVLPPISNLWQEYGSGEFY